MMNAITEPPRVCIVDDESGVRDLLEVVCESAGLPCASFASAEAFLARRCLDGGECRLLLLDIDLPGIDGLGLLALLRDEGLDAPVVMISGAADTAKVVQAMKLGAADFFDKPFNVQAMRDRIRELAAARQ